MSSRSLNKVTLIGNLTRDPELRYTPQGSAVVTFGLATNRTWKTDNGEIRDEVEFHRIVAWNKLAELCSQLLSKGRKAYLEGRLQTRTFTGSDNLSHTITEIVIDDMIVLDSKRPDVIGIGEVPAVSQPAQVVEEVENKANKTIKTNKAKTEEVKKDDMPAMDENVNVDDIPF